MEGWSGSQHIDHRILKKIEEEEYTFKSKLTLYEILLSYTELYSSVHVSCKIYSQHCYSIKTVFMKDVPLSGSIQLLLSPLTEVTHSNISNIIMIMIIAVHTQKMFFLLLFLGQDLTIHFELPLNSLRKLRLTSNSVSLLSRPPVC